MQYNRVMQNNYQAKGVTIEEQYRDLGALFAHDIANAVNKLAKKRAKLSLIRREVAERSWQNLLDNPIASEFCACLSAWASGAKITPSQAMWLLADNLTGCQTFIARYANGVALLHTEEEFIDSTHIEAHMSDPIVVTLDVGSSLVYNNLMPGCGLYAWKPGMIVAVDSLFLKEDHLLEVERPLLANVVSWLIWRMTPAIATPDHILSTISKLGELVDGYAINVIRFVDKHQGGYKLTLARTEARTEWLKEEVGSTLCQNNLIDPKYEPMKWGTPPRNIWRGGYKYYMNRYKTMKNHAYRFRHVAKLTTDTENIENVHMLIQKKILIDLKDDYVNPDMGALCVGLIDPYSTSVSVKKNDQNYDSLEVLNILHL